MRISVVCLLSVVLCNIEIVNAELKVERNPADVLAERWRAENNKRSNLDVGEEPRAKRMQEEQVESERAALEKKLKMEAEAKLKANADAKIKNEKLKQEAKAKIELDAKSKVEETETNSKQKVTEEKSDPSSGKTTEQLQEEAKKAQEDAKIAAKIERENAQKKSAKSDGLKLREQAKQQARERVKKTQQGISLAEPKDEPDQHLTAREKREKAKEMKRQKMAQILRTAQAEMKEQAHGDDAKGLQIKAAASIIKPTCSDSIKNGLESDVDCGGDVCREQTYIFNGLEFARKCGFAQTCNANKDCLSGSCVENKCQARRPFDIKSSTEMIQNMHMAYFQIVGELSRDYLLPNEVSEFFMLALNPDAQNLLPEQQNIVNPALEQFKEEQGLVPNLGISEHVNTQEVRYGFLTRGRCLEFAQMLAKEAFGISSASQDEL